MRLVELKLFYGTKQDFCINVIRPVLTSEEEKYLQVAYALEKNGKLRFPDYKSIAQMGLKRPKPITISGRLNDWVEWYNEDEEIIKIMNYNRVPVHSSHKAKWEWSVHIDENAVLEVTRWFNTIEEFHFTYRTQEEPANNMWVWHVLGFDMS